MNNADEVLQVISIGLVAALFLLNTNRYLKSLELCKECLFILKDRAGLKDEKLSKSFYKRIYFTMWKACSIISDNTSAMIYAEKLLQIYRESGERLEEYKLSRDLLKKYWNQSNYTQVKPLSERALQISKELGDKNGEACCYANLGNVYTSVGEYDKAREYLQKSLVIKKELELETEMEKRGATETLEMCMHQLANMTRRENISRNHL